MFDDADPGAVEQFQEILELHSAGDTENAMQQTTALVSEFPVFAPGWYMLGELHNNELEPKKAIAAFQKAADLSDGEMKAGPLFNIGNCYRSLGDDGHAMQAFQQALEHAPTMLDAWVNLGSALDENGHPAQAIECYDAALHIDELDEDALQNRGNSLRALERYTEAIESYEKCLQVNADNSVARTGRGMCTALNGDFESGLDLLQACFPGARRSQIEHRLATILLGLNRGPEALSLIDRAIAAGEDTPEVQDDRRKIMDALN